MKKTFKGLLESLSEDDGGKIHGGFAVISNSGNNTIVGGETANNCNGGNCYTGCGTNSYAGCDTGNKYNTTPGCGVPKT